MKTTERFDKAVTKLYNAFHNGELNAMDCKMCAVGNMCDNTEEWVLNYESDTGYSQFELENIEKVFMQGYIPETETWRVVEKRFKGNILADGWDAKLVNKDNKDLCFIALCAVIEYLCELDNTPNVMDYTKLFETENNQPKYQLA